MNNTLRVTRTEGVVLMSDDDFRVELDKDVINIPLNREVLIRGGVFEIKSVSAMNNAGVGVKHTVKYRGENCYITRTDQSLDISMVAKKLDNTVDNNTLVGLDIISVLATMLIENNVNCGDIAERIRECSRNRDDLADHLAIILAR